MIPSISLLGLAGLACHVVAQQDLVTDDTHFYGDSPPVFPAPVPQDDGPWGEAVLKAKDIVSQMSLEEKVRMTAGGDPDSPVTGCAGFVPGIPRLGFQGFCLADGPNGPRNTDGVSAWPSGMHVGASWNTALARQRAHYMGREARKKGVNVLLGPAIGPMGRVAKGGRNWEGFSIDPYLMGKMVFETVEGIQEAGVITSTKHWVAQEQETHRLATRGEQMVEAVSSNLDDKTMHELYMWPFYDAVKAGTGNVMCSFNRLNNSYACQNSAAQNGLLKGELGFQGWIVSDWGAQRSGVASALGGLDVAMPSAQGKWGSLLVDAVSNGTVAESVVDNMVTRILASYFKLNQDEDFPAPGYGMPASLLTPHEFVDARDPCSKPTLFNGAVEGHVLVKNANGALPLNPEEVRVLSLFGYSAKAPDKNNYANADFMFGAWSIGAQSANNTATNLGWLGNLTINYSDIAPNGTIISGGGSGAPSQGMFSSPYDALVQRAYEEGTQLFHDFESATPDVIASSDACIVIGNVWATEGHDRPTLRDAYTDDMILHVASQCDNTIVVFHNAGVRLVDSFVDHPNVTAIIYAHLPGQDSGRALTALLYGDVSPSGRLPYTVARNESDYGHLLEPDFTPINGTDRFRLFPQSDFTEGTLVDYRHFDANAIEPRYEFGYGLSYTTFSYSALSIETVPGANALDEYPTGKIMEGGQVDLWDEVVRVTASVTNDGAVDSKEVAQLYVARPGEVDGVKILRGFAKPILKAGETKEVEFQLLRRDSSVWDTGAQKWRLPRGEFRVFVGGSSRDLPLEGELKV